jgi:GlpG protein
VLYGLFGYMWVRGRLDPDGGLALPPDTVVILLGWFVLCLLGVMDTETSRVANVAHAAGLLAGVTLGAAPALLKRAGGRR